MKDVYIITRNFFNDYDYLYGQNHGLSALIEKHNGAPGYYKGEVGQDTFYLKVLEAKKNNKTFRDHTGRKIFCYILKKMSSKEDGREKRDVLNEIHRCFEEKLFNYWEEGERDELEKPVSSINRELDINADILFLSDTVKQLEKEVTELRVKLEPTSAKAIKG